MERTKILMATSLAALLILLPKMECQLKLPPLHVRRPLCTSQFALVGYACSMLPYNSAPSDAAPSISTNSGKQEDKYVDKDNDHDHKHDHDNDHDHKHDHDHDNDHDSDHDHDHDHGHGHDHGHEQGHRHRRHRQRQRHRNQAPLEDCCRWLKELDDECVCELLVRLPSFLLGPEHSYSLRVPGSCNVSYSCPGRVHL